MHATETSLLGYYGMLYDKERKNNNETKKNLTLALETNWGAGIKSDGSIQLLCKSGTASHHVASKLGKIDKL